MSCVKGLWAVDIDSQSGFANVPVEAWLVFHLGLGPGSKVVPEPQQRPANADAEEMVAIAIDRDGEPDPEFMVTWHPCRDYQPTGNEQAFCVAYWLRNHTTWTKQRVDTITWCMPP